MRNMTRDNWIMLGVAAAIVAATAVLVYLPQEKELKAVRTKTAAANLQLASDTAKSSTLAGIIENIHVMKARYRNFDRRLPQRKELAGFLREISGILAAEDLSNQLTEPGNPTRGECYNTLPIIMKFRGSYLSLASLLERMDEMERLTRVQKLTIVKDKKTDALSIEMQMNIYFTES